MVCTGILTCVQSISLPAPWLLPLKFSLHSNSRTVSSNRPRPLFITFLQFYAFRLDILKSASLPESFCEGQFVSSLFCTVSPACANCCGVSSEVDVSVHNPPLLLSVFITSVAPRSWSCPEFNFPVNNENWQIVLLLLLTDTSAFFLRGHDVKALPEADTFQCVSLRVHFPLHLKRFV